MDNNNSYPQRKSPRLQGYDYSQAGFYFVTLCCYQRRCLFGDIAESEMRYSIVGQLASAFWQALPDHFPNVEMDQWVVMPNHMHGLLQITDVGTRYSASASPPLGNVVNSYKGAVTRAARQALSEPDLRIWQSRYHDHIVRNEADLNRIRLYVETNPMRWETDTFFRMET